jgi:hypothetical protein
MHLRPAIASYSGRSYAAIKAFLDSDVLDVIARVADSPVPQAGLDGQICDGLVEMHVFTEEDGLIRLGTAVFLEEDIQRINAAALQFGQELAAQVAEEAAWMRDEAPEIRNFLVGMIGIQQGLGVALRAEGTALDWRNYGGRYARSKVDFYQVCDAYETLGPDLQIKTVLRGTRFTAVFIGPGGESYPLRAQQASGAADPAAYVGYLNAFLTDAYAMLIAGELESPALRSATEQVGLFRDGVPAASVITNETIGPYIPTIQGVQRITHDYYTSQLGSFRELLRSTTSGRQGVPVENLMQNLWRYLRRAITRELYATGFFTDRVPEAGAITVFYDNDVAMLDELLR